MGTIKAGAKIRNTRCPDVHGTFCCLVKARQAPGTLYILSAAHVLGLNGYAEPGDIIEAEESAGTDKWVEVGVYERAYPWFHADGKFQICDAALAKVSAPDLISPEIEGLGTFGSYATGLYQGMPLLLRGAGSGTVTSARIYALDAGVRAVYQDIYSADTFELEYANQILYVRDDGNVPASPTQPMDSGALVLSTDMFPIGMHFSRTPDDYPVNAAVCTPIKTVLDALEVDLVLPGQAGVPLAPAGAAAPVLPAMAAPPSVASVGANGFDAFGVLLGFQMEPHNIFGGIRWQLSPDGLIADGKLDRTAGEPATARRVWTDYGADIMAAAVRYGIPVELIVATICTESHGKADAIRREPGYISDAATPGRISVGLMQTLISTARGTMDDPSIDRAFLLQPANSIMAGAAYIAEQRLDTRLDPPVVACAYNAGGVYRNLAEANRWKLKQYPIGSGVHADRFVQWFNDCFACFKQDPQFKPGATISYVQLLRG